MKCKKERYPKYKQYIKKKNINFTLFIYVFLLSLCIILFFNCAYKIKQHEEKLKHFDPYDILNVSPLSDLQTIKKNYKELILKYHPDKAKSSSSREKYFQIINAYKALTNEKAKENYLKYGHPDGAQAFKLTLAIPKFLFKGTWGFIILLSFAVFVLIILPIWFMKWFNNSNKYNPNTNTLKVNSSIYYYFLNDNTKLNQLPFILGLSNEFSDIYVGEEEFKFIEEEVNKKYENYFINTAENNIEFIIPRGNLKCIYILYSHFCDDINEDYKNKINKKYEDDLIFILSKSKLLIESMLQMCVQCWQLNYIFNSQNNENSDCENKIKKFTYDNIIKTLITFSQCIYQKTNISLEDFSLYQLPNISNGNIVNLINNKISIYDIKKNKNILDGLNVSITKDKIEDIINAVNFIPLFDIVSINTEIKEVDESNYVNIICKIKRIIDGSDNKLIGFKHSLTYPIDFSESILVTVRNEETKDLLDLKIINSISDEIDYKYAEMNEVIGDHKYLIEVFSLNYIGISNKKEVEFNLKKGKGKEQANEDKKRNKLKFNDEEFNYIFKSQIPYFTYLDVGEEEKEEINNMDEHLKKE